MVRICEKILLQGMRWLFVHSVYSDMEVGLFYPS